MPCSTAGPQQTPHMCDGRRRLERSDGKGEEERVGNGKRDNTLHTVGVRHKAGLFPEHFQLCKALAEKVIIDKVVDWNAL